MAAVFRSLTTFCCLVVVARNAGLAGYLMNMLRRIFLAATIFALVPFSALTINASAQSSVNSDDQAGVSDQAAPPYDQAGPQERDRADDQAMPDDPNGDNDESEAAGQPRWDDQSRPDDRAQDNQDNQPQGNQPQNDDRGTATLSGPAGQPGPNDNATANQPDAPARAARLQFITGSVSVQPQGTGDWVNGQLNRPLTNSDNIWADKNSRAELSVGTGLIRIDSESSLTLTRVDQDTVQLQLHQGALNLHVRRLYGNEVYEVDTPNQAFTISKPGDYRFDVDPNADTTVITVWRGEGQSTGDGPAVEVHEGEQARFRNGNSLAHDIHAAPRLDDFDQWARSRDERMDHSQSARYVSPDVPGYEDLDEYGTWKETPDYGNVWVPSGVAVGWAPYRYGHWIWVSPWGWTWVEDEPWGYAPFHYGRWVYWGGSWGWAPGPVYVRPYYAPALVAWFGGGWGVGVGFGGGFGYGWCPLGWGEPFVPWYGYSRGYFGRVNLSNTRFHDFGRFEGAGFGRRFGAVNGFHYANMHVTNGFTAVSRNTLINSQEVARNNIRLSANQMSRMTPVRLLDTRVTPTRTSVLGGARAAATPPSRSFARPTVSRIAPPSRAGGFGNSGGYARSGSAVGGARAGAVGGYPRVNQGAPGRTINVPHPPGATLHSSSPQSGAYGRGRQAPSYQSNNRYGGGPYGRSGPAYGGAYGRPAPGGGAYGRPMPSYGGRPYGGGSYGRSAPAYGGGRAPSYGGGSGGGRPAGGNSSSGRSAGGNGGGGGHTGGGGGGDSHGGHH